MKRINSKMKKIGLACIPILISLTGCRHSYYVPNSQNVPMFKEKNEYRGLVAIGQGAGEEFKSVEVQGAYSVTEKIGVMANFIFASGGDEFDHQFAKGNYLEGALGYYKPVGKFGVFETYGGMGFCKQSHLYDSTYRGSGYKYGTSNLSFNKLFIQPSFGYTFNAFDIALSSRISRVNFNRIERQTISSVSRENTELDNLKFNRNSYVFEPAVTVRGGWKNVKLQLQYVYVVNLTSDELNFAQNQISAGIYISIANRLNE